MKIFLRLVIDKATTADTDSQKYKIGLILGNNEQVIKRNVISLYDST